MTSSRAGRFLVLEGPDGCGKSTQAGRLAAALSAAGRTVRHLRDPGSTHLAEAVRRVLLDPAQGHVAVAAEVCLYLAARAQLAEEVLVPALTAGEDVVCERWTLSTEVYQGLAGGFGAARVRRAARAVLPDVEPDLVLLLDVAEGEGLRRIGRDLDRMEGKGDVFHVRVVRGYRRLAARRPRTGIIEAGTPDDVHARVLAAVAKVAGAPRRGTRG